MNIPHLARQPLQIASVSTIAAIAAIAGCHAASHPAPAGGNLGTTSAPPPAPSAAAAKPGPMATYSDSSSGICFQYPSSWKQSKGATAVLTLIAPAPGAGGGFASLFLDLPKIPPFASGFVTAQAVANGYADDVKKHRIPGAAVQVTDITVAGVAAKDVTATGKETGNAPGLPPAGSQATEEAVTIVRDGKIYIFSADSDSAGTPAAHAALQAAIQSVQWSK
jgi:hypothetical protein